MLSIQRAHDPSLLERRQRSPSVQLGDPRRRLRRVDVEQAHAQRAPPEHARGGGPLEAVEDLERSVRFVRAHGGQLPVLADGSPHGEQVLGVTKAQPGEGFAELGETHVALGLWGCGHAGRPAWASGR
jgi:hypothetical protein